MGRTKGAHNKEKQPEALAMSAEQRIDLLARILIEMIMEDQTA